MITYYILLITQQSLANMPEIYKKANPPHPLITRLSMQIFFEPQTASQTNRVPNSRQRRGRQLPLKNNCL